MIEGSADNVPRGAAGSPLPSGWGGMASWRWWPSGQGGWSMSGDGEETAKRELG